MQPIDGYRVVNLLASDAEAFAVSVRRWRDSDCVRLEVKGYEKRGEKRAYLYLARVASETDDSQLAVANDLWQGTKAFLASNGIAVEESGIERCCHSDLRIVEWVATVDGVTFLRATKL